MDQKYLDKISTVVDFDIESSRVINDGAANLVIEINTEWIFRFSRAELTINQMTLETDFLSVFNGLCPVRIPGIVYADHGFMGYKKIDGVPLRSELLKSLSTEDREKVAHDLGDFLTSLHGFSFAHENLSEFPYGGRNFWEELWNPISSQLSDHASANAKRYFEDAFASMNEYPFKKVITHSDLGTSNVLFNQTQGGIAGIIDFGDMCLHDPARDFNGLYRNHGREFTEQVLCFYKGDVEPNFWKRIEFYAKKHFFQMMFYAPKFGLEQYVPDCLKEIEESFATPA